MPRISKRSNMESAGRIIASVVCDEDTHCWRIEGLAVAFSSEKDAWACFHAHFDSVTGKLKPGLPVHNPKFGFGWIAGPVSVVDGVEKYLVEYYPGPGGGHHTLNDLRIAAKLPEANFSHH